MSVDVGPPHKSTSGERKLEELLSSLLARGWEDEGNSELPPGWQLIRCKFCDEFSKTVATFAHDDDCPYAKARAFLDSLG